ncbi:hypothetical protein HWV03_02040 [Moritella sp. 36]|uniref:hypothetical protein n=1 Tax=Moritella sp. 36 TaxID=2746233 RepID=UPI001BA52B12|nr:hypothetical protein [Moritella sp. 36]QUM87700.1 hypothetical protein HWV03_02040 [Moritella sp. 36]
MILGVFLFFLGAFSMVYFRKGAFERRNDAGVEEFSSYWAMLAIRFLEKFSKVSLVIGLVMIFVSLKS